ncbi:MAG: PAS domain-containing sensor histidine kinase [Candidatus Thermoplasmatota archaeon]|nr:PAS domain-containing sensor histidine kinase [Candidatus Thermoplasmatota archaeon]
MNEIPDIVKELREQEIKYKTPDIVKELKELEKCGKLESKSFEINNNSKNYNNTTLLKKEKHDSMKTNFRKESNLTSIIQGSKMLFDLSPEGIAIIDKNGHFLDANTKICEWFEFRYNEIMGKNIFDFLFLIEGNEISIKNLFLKDIIDDDVISQEIGYIKKNRERVFGMLNISPIILSQNEISGYIIMISDITDIKKAEEEINKLSQFHENIIDNANVWLSVIDPQSKIIIWNKAAENITGFSRDEVIGHNKIWDWLQPADNLVNIKRNSKMNLESGENILTENFEKTIVRKDGEKRTISWNSRMLYDNVNNPIGNIALGQDITERKKYEDKINKQNEELTEINSNLEEKVKDRTKQIQHLLRQKDEFINQLSHDLKTPLTPMMVLLPLLKEKIKNKKDTESFDVVLRNVYFMKDLVNKTIDLAKLNSGIIQLEFQTINLNEELEFIIGNNQVLFDRNDIKIINRIKDQIFVFADKIRLDEVFNNLITNAIKYSPDKGGKIYIDAKEDKERFTISIKDTGLGMDSEQIELVFDEFYKVDDSRHELDSSGLGLTITKKIIEKHGGKIWVESEGTGKGSTFYFTLKKSKIKKKN